MDPSRLPSICQLQTEILTRALTILEPGGLAIYSTCSLSFKQNEGVVQNIIEQWNTSENNRSCLELEDVFEGLMDDGQMMRFGLVRSKGSKMYRIAPGVESASAMFIAKIRKKIVDSASKNESLVK